MLKGLSAFPITPADADGRVDVPALRRLLARLNEPGVDSIGLLGSTGTYAYLDRAERRRTVEAALEEVGDAIPVVVGIGALRTDEAVRLAQDAKQAGAAAGLLAAVSYTPLTDAEVFAHFETVARESGLPLCIYDNPTTTHFRFTPTLVGRLSRVPGIVAVKSPSPPPGEAAAHLAALREAVPEGFTLGYSGDWNATATLVAGGDSWFSVIAGLFPERAAAIVAAARAGDAAEALRLDAELAPLWELMRSHSGLRVMYACADRLGLCRAAPPRPILPLPDEVLREVSRTLSAIGLA